MQVLLFVSVLLKHLMYYTGTTSLQRRASTEHQRRKVNTVTEIDTETVAETGRETEVGHLTPRAPRRNTQDATELNIPVRPAAVTCVLQHCSISCIRAESAAF